MLESLFGSINKERVLFFIYARSQGHARDMARFYSCSLTPLQRQLEILERGGVLVSSLVGRTRLYSFNPRYPLLSELSALIDRALTFYPEEERTRLQMERQRPRRARKPL